MNNESKKLTWAVGLVAGLGVLSIAYAALSSTLNIKGENATVNAGYVRFVGGDSELVENTSGSQPWAIGSTNTEYIGTGGKISGGIFERDDSSTGAIMTTTNFAKNWAKALAEPGTFSLEKTSKLKDTVKIEGAKLNDYGSFIIYRLDIINESTNDMRLKTLPDIILDSIETGEGKAVDGNIERKIYTDFDSTNFVTPCSTELTKTEKDTDGTITGQTNFNYLGKNVGKTTWYLRVGFKNYDEANNNIHGTTKFSFSVNPNWEAVVD